MHEDSVTIRKLHREDVAPLRRILQDTNFFSDEEIGTAVELMDIFLSDPNQNDYDLYTAVIATGEVAGYICVGPTPLTVGTYDLYWVAVNPEFQRQGVGKRLTLFADELIKSKGGRLLIAETSSQPKYESTRRFYITQHFQQLACIKDYYRRGDDLVVYGKYYSQ